MMRKNFFTHRKFFSACASVLLVGVSGLFGQVTQTFVFTGSTQTYVIPSCVSTITIEAWGAQGASQTPGGTGGLGGYVKGVFSVAPGIVFNINVGGQNGFNGGGIGGVNGNSVTSGVPTGSAGSGGGATDIRVGGTAFTDRIFVAGGGGGAGHNGTWTNCQVAGPAGNGGLGGGATGGPGSTGSSTACNCTGGGGNGGGGATATAGGAAGTYNNIGCLQGWSIGSPGTLGNGGNGSITYHNGTGGGGGGGGGYYGGGSAGSGSDTTPGGGGGGGSSFTGTATSVTSSQGVQSGNGMVVISYIPNGGIVLAGASSNTICNGAVVTLTAGNVVSYTWSPGGSNATSLNVSPTASTVYTVQATNSNNCISTVTLPITVNAAVPALTVNASATSVCPNNTVMLTATGAYTYTWSNSITNAVSFTPAVTNVYTVTGTNACGNSTSTISVSVTPLPVTAVASSTLVCSATPATLTAGGAASFTWMPGSNTSTNYIISPVANSTYTVLGKTGTCTGSTTINISTKPNPTMTITASSTIVCEGLPVTLNVTGDASTYTWNPGGLTGTSISPSPTMATLYTVIGTSTNNCTSSTSQAILVASAPVISAGVSNAEVCVGGASTLFVTGGNTYQWSSNAGSSTSSATVINPVATDSYTVVVTNTAGCSTTSVVSVSVFDPTVGVSSNTAVCLGRTAQLSAAGADSYVWSTGQGFAVITVTPAANTVYTVTGTVSQNGLSCTGTNTVSVSVNPNPTVTAGSTRTAICLSESNVITAGGAVSYTWATPSGPLTGASVTVSPVISTTYSVNGEDANGCKGTNSFFLKVTNCVGINVNTLNTPNLLVYPNPSSGEFTISTDQAIDLQIVNELGQLVKTVSLNGSDAKATVSGLANGIYFIAGKNANGSVKEKIIVNK